MRIRTYTELKMFHTFEERYEYLKLGGYVGRETFGFDRYLNQRFYTSREWRQTRQHVIARDLGRDLALEGYDIFGKIVVHHMNPMTADDIVHSDPDILNIDQLVCVSHDTHNAIHYGDISLLKTLPPERRRGDTQLW